MKKSTKKNRLWLIGMSFLFCTVIYSCLQDEWETGNNTKEGKVIVGNNKELTVTAAQQWYEEHNKPVVTVRSVDNDENEILTKPKWEEAKESRQSNFEVVETTLMTNGSTMFMDSETKSRFNPQTDAKRVHNIARMVVIKNLKTGKICNFIMIFAGTYDYLKTTRTFGKNSYLHREPDLNGDVFFYEPEGGLVNGWRYRNGKITARISRGTEEGFRMATTTRGTYQRCTSDCYWVNDTNCWGEPYFDEELGGWGPSANCETISYPVYIESCETVDDGTSEGPVEPWIPDEQPGGYEPPVNPKPEPEQKPELTPCDKAKNLSKDTMFVNRVNETYKKTFPHKAGNTEQGFILTSTGQTIYPEISDMGRVKFTNQQIGSSEFMAWYHSHPTGGAAIPSIADLKALAIRYQQTHIKSDKFSYGIISEHGCLSITITSPIDFDKFATKIRNKELDNYWDKNINNGQSRTSYETMITLFIKFINEYQSGLNVSFRTMQDTDVNNNNDSWKSKELNETNELINTDCNN